MRKLLLATRNKNKISEIKEILGDLDLEFISLDEVAVIAKSFAVKENGKTFLENAALKARIYGQMSGLLTLADDSGLEVKALSGRPGIRSSRYIKGGDQDRYRKLLREMEKVETSRRQARFVCAVVVFNPESGQTISSEGVCQGVISRAPQGSNGFGYDPIFFLPLVGKTMAQLTAQEKNIFSHRGQALRKIRLLVSRGKISKNSRRQGRKDKQKASESDKKTYNEEKADITG